MRKTTKKPPEGRPAAVAGAIFVLIVVAAGLVWRATSGRPLRPVPPRNVLLITIDTLRADALGSYGSSTAATPWLDRLAAGGLRFTNARAHNVVTLPSHANILTGRLPPDHGVRDNAGFRLAASEETLATRLEAAGFRTGAFISAFPLDSRFGLSRGFAVYDDAFVDAAPRPAFLEQERPGGKTVDAASRWIKSSKYGGGAPREQRWLAWIHLFEPHYPYVPPAPFATRFQTDSYAGEVAAADAALGPILQPILDAGATTDTLVVVTSDHGESLGDHGEATHGIFAYEATLRVPLVIYYPPRFEARVVDAPASHVDILPTILDALDMSTPPGLRGRSLIEAAPDSGRFTYFEALSGSLNRGWAPLAGIVANGAKFIDLPIPELYDLRADPGESRNLAGEQPGQVAASRALLRSVSNLEVRRADDTSEVKERLRALGYVASSPPQRAKAYTEADDPKRLIGVDTALQEIVGLSLDGKGPDALARAREVAARHPGMRVALLQLAHLEREAGNLPQAIDVLRNALTQNPGDAETASLLGAYLTADNRQREAAEVLRPYAAAGDADVQVLVALALAEARSSNFPAALQVLEKARAQDPSNTMLLVTLGTVELMAGRRSQARAAFDAALAINPETARAHSSLGALLAEEGQLDESLGHWRQAITLDPAENEKLLAVGISLARAGRRREARPFFQLFADSAPAARYAQDVARAREWLSREAR
jgi:choline-sulfatase